MTPTRAILAALMCVITCCSSIRADEIQLSNGDRLHGTLVSMKGCKLIYCHEGLGELEICWSDVTAITTDCPFIVTNGCGDKAEGLLRPGKEEDMLEIVTDKGVVSYSMCDICKLKAPCDPCDPCSRKVKWFGEISAKLSESDGNTDTFDFGGEAEITREFKICDDVISTWKNNLELRFKQAGQNVYISQGDWRSIYQRNFAKKWFWRVAEQIRFNRSDNLTTYTETYGALGIWVWKNDWNSMQFYEGAGYIDAWFGQGKDDDSGFYWINGLEFDQKITDNLKFNYQLEYDPKFTNLDDWWLESYAVLKYKLCETWEIKLEHDFYWDSKPPVGKEHFDSYIDGKLTYKF